MMRWEKVRLKKESFEKWVLQVIDTLKLQLNETKYLRAPLEGVNFEYGFNTETLQMVMAYWRSDYLSRWYKEREYYIGKFPHYQTKIQGYFFLCAIHNRFFKNLFIPAWTSTIFMSILKMLQNPPKSSHYCSYTVGPVLFSNTMTSSLNWWNLQNPFLLRLNS